MTYIAFLRAVNVGGRTIVKMNDLKQAFSLAGCERVRTYIQSGNIVFDAPKRSVAEIIRRLQTRLREVLGREATVVLRTLREVESTVKRNPFKKPKADTDAKLYVAFLSRKPLRKPRFPLMSPKERLEAFQLRNLEVFIVSRRKKNGMYGFPNNFIEKELGVPATTRNWSTVTKLVALSSQ